jgi:hypothetical protein
MFSIIVLKTTNHTGMLEVNTVFYESCSAKAALLTCGLRKRILLRRKW